MTNNNLSCSFTNGAAYTGTIYSIYNNGGTVTTTLNMNTNNFSNYTFTTVSGTGSIYYCYNANGNANISISNNTWTNLSINNSGGNYLMYNNTSTQIALNVNNNSIVTGYTRIAASGTFYIYFSVGSSLGTSTQTFSGNNFSNITSSTAGTGYFCGFWNTDGYSSPYPKKMVFNNTFSNINYNTTDPSYIMINCGMGDGSTTSGSSIYNNTVTNITVGGYFYCMVVDDPISPTHPLNVYDNVVGNIATTGAASVIIGFYYGPNTSGMNFYKNKIFGVQSGGAAPIFSAVGFYSVGASYYNIFNNYIGDIKAPSASLPSLEPSASGIYLANGSTVNIYYNTVYLNASSTGTNFGTVAIHADASITLTLRDNIFENLSIPNGNGKTIAFQHGQTFWTNYGALSNNNDFYAGTPGANNLIMSDGTNSYSTLAAYKTAVSPRDSNSITENPPFLSTTGSDANYLHIGSSTPTQIESGGASISNYIDDYDGDLRQGEIGYVGTGTAPDIGADEFNGLPFNVIPPTISGPTLVCAGSTGNVYTTESGMSNYAWSVSAGGTITSGGGPSDYTATVTWNTAGARAISVNYQNAGGQWAPSATVYNVTVNAQPVPTITGQNSMCVNSGYYDYTTEAGMTNYVWALSSGGVINYGAGTNQIQVSWTGAGAQTISVNYSNGAGCNATIPTVLTITVNPLPGPAGTITGTANVCAGDNGMAYSVAPITNTATYVWTLLSGAIIVSGAGTNSITVNFDTVTVSGNFYVYGNNVCGNGGTSPAFGVTVNPIPETPVVTNSGNILTSSAPVGNQWYFEGNLIAGATSQTYDATLTGTGFYWTVVTINGCSSDTSNHKLVITTGVEPQSSLAISVYPVPNDGKFNISISASDKELYSISIYNSLGILVYEEAKVEVKSSLKKMINLNPVPKGVYTLIFSSSHSQIVKKIVVNK